MAWQQDGDVSLDDCNNQRKCLLPDAPGSIGTHESPPSVVYDRGDENQLNFSRHKRTGMDPDKPKSPLERGATGDLVSHTGTNPDLVITPVRHERQNISTNDLHGEPESLDLEAALIDALYKKPSKRAGDPEEFLPFDELEKIISRENVRKELQRLGMEGDLDAKARSIWDMHACLSPRRENEMRRSSTCQRTTRRKIFAILLRLSSARYIDDFIDAGLFDRDLPFTFEFNASNKVHKARVTTECNGVTTPVHVFDMRDREVWSRLVLDGFARLQWQFLAPFFNIRGTSLGKPVYHVLDDKEILPFIDDNEDDPASTRYGNAKVWSVRIHPAHHDGCQDVVSFASTYAGMQHHLIALTKGNPPLAIKRLKLAPNSQDKFRNEVSVLEHITDHRHVIKLLMTYSYRGEYHLVFPLADGNLVEFWKTEFPDPMMPSRNYDFAVWFSEQCLGIAQGLDHIHNPGSMHAKASRLHGRHGDLKPPNILFWKNYQDGSKGFSNLGHFKICDMGLAEFHHTCSMDVTTTDLGRTRTYRAPEIDVTDSVSSSYDIWALGCLLLEFVAWYLGGWDEISWFIERRCQDDQPLTPTVQEDTFFNLTTVEGNPNKKSAIMKQSVCDEFNRLREHDRCSDYIIDFLDFVQDCLLRMHPEKRAKTDHILKKLSELHDKCKANAEYCTARSSTPLARADTELSQLDPTKPSSSQPRRINRDLPSDDISNADTKEEARKLELPPHANVKNGSQIDHSSDSGATEVRRGILKREGHLQEAQDTDGHSASSQQERVLPTYKKEETGSTVPSTPFTGSFGDPDGLHSVDEAHNSPMTTQPLDGSLILNDAEIPIPVSPSKTPQVSDSSNAVSETEATRLAAVPNAKSDPEVRVANSQISGNWVGEDPNSASLETEAIAVGPTLDKPASVAPSSAPVPQAQSPQPNDNIAMRPRTPSSAFLQRLKTLNPFKRTRESSRPSSQKSVSTTSYEKRRPANRQPRRWRSGLLHWPTRHSVPGN